VSFLFRNNYSQPANRRLGLMDTQSATNAQAEPLPVLYGKRRFAGTFISDAFNQSTQNVGGGGKNSGKGGGGSGTNYYCDFVAAFSIGPCDSIQDLFLNGDAVFTEQNYITPTLLSQVNNLATINFTGNPFSGFSGANPPTIVITGADQPEFNGEFVTTWINANSLTYVIPGTSIAAEQASGNIEVWIKLPPIYRANSGPNSTVVTIPNYGTITLYWGTETQPVDPTWGPTAGTAESPLRGICYGVFQNWYLGLNQTNIQNLEIVLSRCPAPAWLLNPAHANINDEANPAVVFYDLLTNPRIGFGLLATDFNLQLLAAAAEQFYNDGIAVSNVVNRQDDALSLIQQICESTDSLCILDANGLLTLLPIRAPANYAAVQQITDANLADLPKPKASDWSNTVNETRIVFPNNLDAWVDDFVEWKDFAGNIAAQKTNAPQTLQRPWITSRATALALVQAAGAAAAVPPATGTMDLLFTPALWSAMSPGSLFQNAFVNATTARANGIFRVLKRTWNDPAKPVFTIEYAADRSYLNTNFANL
jgi:hypothetical protein